MTQEDQETLNEMFLGEEDPDMAFKKPMTNNLKEIPDLYNYLEGRLLKYIGSADSLFGEEIHSLLRGLEDDILNLINQKEKEHKLEAYLEIDLLVAEQEQRYETLEYTELHQDLDQRIKQLKEELNKEVL